MGKRITKVYTKTGDDGTTGIAGNIRLAKNDPLIHAIGEIDELNSEIGVIVAFCHDAAINAELQAIQHDLFNAGGLFAYPAFDGFDAGRVEALEQLIDLYNEELAPLEEFILPGGEQVASLALKTRAVCRRVERGMADLQAHYQANEVGFDQPSHQQIHGVSKYINRLSDLLFTMGRALNSRAAFPEILWKHHKPNTI